ncbi:MAG: response regulator transcription factor [Acidimicrobiales bacterium]
MNVLLVEDDARIVSFLQKGLRAEGYVTEVAASVQQAVAYIDPSGDDVDLVLLDLGLPDGAGEEVLAHLRRKGSGVPVIMLTARGEVDDKVRGLELGANDYITKPFAFEELLARMRVALRPSAQPVAQELVVGDLRLDLLTKVAWRAGRRIDLAPREWALLELFLRNPTHVLSRTRILSRVWEFGYDPGSNVVDVYVGYLRRKLNRPGLAPLIQTVRGAGYRLLPP